MPEHHKTSSKGWLRMAILDNPLLVQAIGLTAVIVGATSLRAALIISVLTAAHIILCEALAAGPLKKLPEWLRIAVYFAVGLLIACPATYWVDQFKTVSLVALRIFLPLLSVNAFAAARCERYAVRHTAGDALRDAIANALGFTLVALVVGALREILGAGTIWDREVTKIFTRGALMPFGGFLLMGAMAAGLKIFLRLLGVRGVAQGAEEAMELAPEDRVERLEKVRQLMEQPEPSPKPAPVPEPETEPETEAFVPPKLIPVEQILEGLDGDFEYMNDTDIPLTPLEKARLFEELENLLDDFK